MRLSQLADLAKTLDATSFAARITDPVLIGSDVFTALERGVSFDTPERGTPLSGFRAPPRAASHVDPELATSFDVMESVSNAVAEATPSQGVSMSDADPELIFVTKSKRNPFAQMITVGRSANNDILLDDKAVSKVHGYFKRTDFRWWIHDQPSTNGTFVGETRVGASGHPLSDGDKIWFGTRIAFSFYTPRGLHQLITGRRA